MNVYKWYVYKLIDPRCGSVFYVGKGTGNRMYQHQRLSSRDNNQAKKDRIMEIHDCGHRVVHRDIAYFMDEDAAYDHEACQIAEIGIDNLTNISPGQYGEGSPSWLTYNEWARFMNWYNFLSAWETAKTACVEWTAFYGAKGEYGRRPVDKFPHAFTRLLSVDKATYPAADAIDALVDGGAHHGILETLDNFIRSKYGIQLEVCHNG